MTLSVGIIGAGIGGLSAAIALRRTGAQVEVCFRRQSVTGKPTSRPDFREEQFSK